MELRRLKDDKDLKKGIAALTSIFIEEYPYYSIWISKHMDQFENGEKQILSVENDGEILGYFMIHFCSKNIVKTNGIYIFEEYKGQGIATNAIVELVNLLKSCSVDLIYVQTRLDNNAVVHLFDKTGFKLIGTNYHQVEKKDNWVACNKLTYSSLDEQQVAFELYDGFSSLDSDEIEKIKEEHKNGNLVLKKTKIGD